MSTTRWFTVVLIWAVFWVKGGISLSETIGQLTWCIFSWTKNSISTSLMLPTSCLNTRTVRCFERKHKMVSSSCHYSLIFILLEFLSILTRKSNRFFTLVLEFELYITVTVGSTSLPFGWPIPLTVTVCTTMKPLIEI